MKHCNECGRPFAQTEDYNRVQGRGDVCDHCLALLLQDCAGTISLPFGSWELVIQPAETWITVRDFAKYHLLFASRGIVVEYPRIFRNDDQPSMTGVLAIEQHGAAWYAWLNDGFGMPTPDMRVEVKPDQKLRVTRRLYPLAIKWYIRQYGGDFDIEGRFFIDPQSTGFPFSGLALYVERPKLSDDPSYPYRATVQWSGSASGPDEADLYGATLSAAATIGRNLAGGLNRQFPNPLHMKPAKAISHAD